MMRWTAPAATAARRQVYSTAQPQQLDNEKHVSQFDLYSQPLCEKETKRSNKFSLVLRNNFFAPYFGLLKVTAQVLTGAIVLAAIVYLLSPHPWRVGGIVVATLLNVHDGKSYVHALRNPLYRDLQQGVFYNDVSANSDKSVQLLVSTTILYPKKSITVSWEGSVFDEDVIIMLCGNETSTLDHVIDPSLILEAATIRQAKTTSLQNKLYDDNTESQNTNPDDDENNSWYISNFPVLRHDQCRFLLYRNHYKRKLYPLASSNLVVLQNHKQTPVGVHLAYTNDPTSMVVHFTTGLLDNTQPVVAYYPSNDNNDGDYNYVNGGTTTTYDADNLCRPPANRLAPGHFSHPGAMHAVTMTDLTAGYTYQYRVGLQDLENDESILVWSDTFEFTAALEPGDTTPFSYLVYADQGCPHEGGWSLARNWMEGLLQRSSTSQESSLQIVALHHFGDLSYAMGASHQWDAWLDTMELVAAKWPLMIAIGNHEYDYTSVADNADFQDPSGWDYTMSGGGSYSPAWGNFRDDSKGECGVPTASRFTMPASDSEANGLFWYSHEYGLVHTTVLSAEHNMSVGSPQYEWLAQDLANVDRSTTPWLVLEMHRPLYESETYFSDNVVSIAMRGKIEDLLFENKVDLLLSGHYHAYLRTCQGLYKSQCGVAGAPMHITVGTAGVGLDNAALYFNNWTAKFINTEFGFGRITVHNSTAMHFEFIRAGGVDEEGAGETLDEVWLVRDRE